MMGAKKPASKLSDAAKGTRDIRSFFKPPPKISQSQEPAPQPPPPQQQQEPVATSSTAPSEYATPLSHPPTPRINAATVISRDPEALESLVNAKRSRLAAEEDDDLVFEDEPLVKRSHHGSEEPRADRRMSSDLLFEVDEDPMEVQVLESLRPGLSQQNDPQNDQQLDISIVAATTTETIDLMDSPVSAIVVESTTHSPAEPATTITEAKASTTISPAAKSLAASTSPRPTTKATTVLESDDEDDWLKEADKLFAFKPKVVERPPIVDLTDMDEDVESKLPDKVAMQLKAETETTTSRRVLRSRVPIATLPHPQRSENIKFLKDMDKKSKLLASFLKEKQKSDEMLSKAEELSKELEEGEAKESEKEGVDKTAGKLVTAAADEGDDPTRMVDMVREDMQDSLVEEMHLFGAPKAFPRIHQVDPSAPLLSRPISIMAQLRSLRVKLLGGRVLSQEIATQLFKIACYHHKEEALTAADILLDEIKNPTQEAITITYSVLFEALVVFGLSEDFLQSKDTNGSTYLKRVPSSESRDSITCTHTASFPLFNSVLALKLYADSLVPRIQKNRETTVLKDIEDAILLYSCLSLDARGVLRPYLLQFIHNLWACLEMSQDGASQSTTMVTIPEVGTTDGTQVQPLLQETALANENKKRQQQQVCFKNIVKAMHGFVGSHVISQVGLLPRFGEPAGITQLRRKVVAVLLLLNGPDGGFLEEGEIIEQPKKEEDDASGDEDSGVNENDEMDAVRDSAVNPAVPEFQANDEGDKNAVAGDVEMTAASLTTEHEKKVDALAPTDMDKMRVDDAPAMPNQEAHNEPNIELTGAVQSREEAGDSFEERAAVASNFPQDQEMVGVESRGVAKDTQSSSALPLKNRTTMNADGAPINEPEKEGARIVEISREDTMTHMPLAENAVDDVFLENFNWRQALQRIVAVVKCYNVSPTPFSPTSSSFEQESRKQKKLVVNYKKLSACLDMLQFVFEESGDARKNTEACQQLIPVLLRLHRKISDARLTDLDRTRAKHKLHQLKTRIELLLPKRPGSGGSSGNSSIYDDSDATGSSNSSSTGTHKRVSAQNIQTKLRFQ